MSAGRGLLPRPAHFLVSMRSIVVVLWLGWAACLVAADAAPGDAGVAFLEKRTQDDPADFIAWAQLAERYLQQYRERGAPVWLERARRAADESLRDVAPASNPAGVGIAAQVALAEHRFADAAKLARQWQKSSPGKAAPMALLVDALLESGQLAEAESWLGKLEDRVGSPLLAEPRRARWLRLRGELDAAMEHYEAARIAAKEQSQHYWIAWAEVQMGEVEFSRGNWDEAEGHYRAALQAQPGWWSAEEHLAELSAARGEDEAAVRAYEAVIAKTPRAELFQALGDYHQFKGRKEAAISWHDRALAAYRGPKGDTPTTSYHHLAGFFTDSVRNGAEAVRWARKDLELRDTAAARDALAWALYHAGELKEARAEIEKAVAQRPRDPHILEHAATIRMASGDLPGGEAALRAAAAANPKYTSFHVHR